MLYSHSTQRQPLRRARTYASHEDSLENWSPVRYLKKDETVRLSQLVPCKAGELKTTRVLRHEKSILYLFSLAARGSGVCFVCCTTKRGRFTSTSPKEIVCSSDLPTQHFTPTHLLWSAPTHEDIKQCLTCCVMTRSSSCRAVDPCPDAHCCPDTRRCGCDVRTGSP